MWIVVIILAGVITGSIQLVLDPSDVDTARIMEVMLLHQFVVSHGIIAVGGFIINVLKPEETAVKLG